MRTALFGRFELRLTRQDAAACSHPGPCDDEVKSAMPESYYERWHALYHAEKRARREGKWDTWRRAAKRLTDHENAHCEHPFDRPNAAGERPLPAGDKP